MKTKIFSTNKQVATVSKLNPNLFSVFVLTFFFLPLILYSQTYPQVTEERPRINIPHDKFDIIKSLLNDSNQERIDELFEQIDMNSWAYNNWTCDNDFNIKLCGNPNVELLTYPAYKVKNNKYLNFEK